MDFPKIETKRLILNQPHDSDIESIVKILNNKIYSENTLNMPFPYTTESAKFWINLSENGFKNQNHYIFAIRRKEDNQIIGGIDLNIDKAFNKAELGYWMDINFWNNAYTTEAVKAIIDFGFETLHLKRIFATHFDFNPASGKVMQKAGMTMEGILKANSKKGDKYQNHVLYAIVKD